MRRKVQAVHIAEIIVAAIIIIIIACQLQREQQQQQSQVLLDESRARVRQHQQRLPAIEERHEQKEIPRTKEQS